MMIMKSDEPPVAAEDWPDGNVADKIDTVAAPPAPRFVVLHRRL